MKTQTDFFSSYNKQYLNKMYEYQPLEQNYFADQLFQITQRFIPTSYGQIFSITAGSPGQPLILIVHGSGPRNSSQQYSYLLQQYLVRISYIQKFYIVAIDCPGYGKSIGSKQAVKTFPKQMFQQILKALNYKQYFAMYGHSQGGAAIFNAVYQNPLLSQVLLMDCPVCGNIQRFRKFNIPTLLVYDIQDDGHPIWQGKLLYKQLTYSEFYTYKDSEDSYWVPNNIWDKMLSFFSKYANNRKGRPNIFTNQRPLSLNPSVNFKSKQKPKKKLQEGLKFQKEKSQANNKRKQQKSKSISLSKIHKNHSLDSRKIENSYKKSKKLVQKEKCKELQKVEQVDLQKDQLLSIYSSSLSEQEKKQLKLIEEEMKQKQVQLLKDEKQLFIKQGKIYQIDQKIVIDTSEKQQVDLKLQLKNLKLEQKLTQPISQKKQIKQLSEQQQNYRCAICYDVYYRPIQINCNHIFCTKCLLEALLVNIRCPLCRANITKKTQKKQLHQQILSKMKPQDIQKRQKAYLKLKLMLDSIVMIEIGNRSIQLQTKKSHFSKIKKKYMWQLFVKEKANFKFQEVSFNINMGDPYSKPVKVKNGPFVFQSRGTFSFSCQIIVKPRNQQYAPLTTIYRINIEPGTHTQTIAFKKKIYLKQ